MTVLYKRTILPIPFYHFIGSEYDWRRLIIGNIKNFEYTYLLDSEVNRRMYPPEVKVINSIQTIKRVQFAELNKSIIFVGELNQRSLLAWEWSRASCIVLKTSLKDLLELITYKIVEKSSKKNISYLRKYK